MLKGKPEKMMYNPYIKRCYSIEYKKGFEDVPYNIDPPRNPVYFIRTGYKNGDSPGYVEEKHGTEVRVSIEMLKTPEGKIVRGKKGYVNNQNIPDKINRFDQTIIAS